MTLTGNPGKILIYFIQNSGLISTNACLRKTLVRTSSRALHQTLCALRGAPSLFINILNDKKNFFVLYCTHAYESFPSIEANCRLCSIPCSCFVHVSFVMTRPNSSFLDNPLHIQDLSCILSMVLALCLHPPYARPLHPRLCILRQLFDQLVHFINAF